MKIPPATDGTVFVLMLLVFLIQMPVVDVAWEWLPKEIPSLTLPFNDVSGFFKWFMSDDVLPFMLTLLLILGIMYLYILAIFGLPLLAAFLYIYYDHKREGAD